MKRTRKPRRKILFPPDVEKEVEDRRGSRPFATYVIDRLRHAFGLPAPEKTDAGRMRGVYSDAAASALARRGGLKGGPARAAALVAQKAKRARWAKAKRDWRAKAARARRERQTSDPTEV